MLLDMDPRRQRRSRSRGVTQGVLVAAGFVVLGALVVFLGFRIEASRVPDVTNVERVTLPEKSVDPRPRLSVIGDSMSSGTPSNSLTWVDIVSSERGLVVNVAARGGSGYVSGARNGKSFESQVDQALRSNPETLIVFGSRNDWKYAPEEVGEAAATLYDRLRSLAPETRLVVVGPIWTPGQSLPGEIVAVDRAIQSAAQSRGIAYSDALFSDWLVGPEFILPDGVNPNDEGQRAIAGKIGDVAFGPA